LFTVCPAAEVLGGCESDKPGLVAEYTKEDKNGNQADEDYLLPHSISYDNPK